ncbi:hypothetical protein [Siminovitchia sp. 179-K 8D1 HS]|uniref:hypothetical protein n=1 Tax=Siminovitchia sp. 179-K 8D1 HS TaxID=3142385 RepID=UPI0039A23743
MRFDLGDEVIVKKTLETGRIKHCRFEKYEANGQIIEKTTYAVSTGKYYSDWHEESSLRHVDDYKLEFEIGLLDLRISAAINENKPDVAKRLYEEKQKILNKKNI